ncbi:unnamed protein product [Fusarium graminearum]|uniref:Chromosome 1, complete genome n=1 Tax=Gibberella zeae (strain ATCC MYA-4620 / CBS 123657 / FGSC 9075 / NRRL 31084 / PH-1) TaxID=229533 RepID=A0A098D5M7_GIBZE|nr:unnamed protein product [Fusarium graminearum]
MVPRQGETSFHAFFLRRSKDTPFTRFQSAVEKRKKRRRQEERAATAYAGVKKKTRAKKPKPEPEPTGLEEIMNKINPPSR